MSRRNSIIVEANPQGQFVEGIIDTAESPGTIVQLDTSQALVGGRHHWVVYNRDADGNRPAGPFIVLTEDSLQGKLMTDAYTAGARAFGYVPAAGEELNLLYKNETGTADDVAVGTLMIVDDGTGKITVTGGSPETEVAMALEALTDPTADTLLWVSWTGF